MICWGVRQRRPRNAKGDAALPNGSVGLWAWGSQKIDHISCSNLVPIWFHFGSNTFLHVTVTERSKGMEGVAFSTRPKIWPPSSPRHPGFKLQLWQGQLQTWRWKHGRIEMHCMTPPNPSHFEQKLVVACFLLPSGNSGLTLLCRCSLQSKIGLRLAKCCNFTGQSCRLGTTMRRARGCTASKRSPFVLALHSCAQLWFHGCPLYKFRLRAAWRAAQSSRWWPKWCYVQTMHVPSNEGMKRCL